MATCLKSSSNLLFVPVCPLLDYAAKKHRDNPLWTESALKYYEEQELSMQVSPNDVVGQMLAAAASSHQHQHQQGNGGSSVGGQVSPADILSPHYSALLESSRTKQRQRLPDSEVSSRN